MSNLQVAENIANLIGGRSLITQLLSPKHLMGGENSLGIRLKKQNKNKIKEHSKSQKNCFFFLSISFDRIFLFFIRNTE